MQRTKLNLAGEWKSWQANGSSPGRSVLIITDNYEQVRRTPYRVSNGTHHLSSLFSWTLQSAGKIWWVARADNIFHLNTSLLRVRRLRSMTRSRLLDRTLLWRCRQIHHQDYTEPLEAHLVTCRSESLTSLSDSEHRAPQADWTLQAICRVEGSSDL